jgi:MerR family transcriptional regulator, mercuric resistance operon regulatory protein
MVVGRTQDCRQRQTAKLAEVETRIEDLEVIRKTLVAALDAGCDDLLACANSNCCPLPFAEIAHPEDPAKETCA